MDINQLRERITTRNGCPHIELTTDEYIKIRYLASRATWHSICEDIEVGIPGNARAEYAIYVIKNLLAQQ